MDGWRTARVLNGLCFQEDVVEANARVAASWQQGLLDVSWFYPRSKTSTASTVGKWRAISCQVSPSSRLAKTEPEFVPK